MQKYCRKRTGLCGFAVNVTSSLQKRASFMFGTDTKEWSFVIWFPPGIFSGGNLISYFIYKKVSINCGYLLA